MTWPRRTFAEPDPLSTLQEWQRWTGTDIPHLDDAELASEARYFQSRVWPLPVGAWQRERLRMLQDELRKRGIVRQRQPERQPASTAKHTGGVGL